MALPTYNTTYQIWRSDKHSNRLKTKKADFVDEIKYPACDLGENNPQKQIIVSKYNLSIQSIDSTDFNWDKIPPHKEYWSIIICFEILEHILNPLLFLGNIYDSLYNNGICYLSIPYSYHFLWSNDHFYEPDNKRLKWMFDEVGFVVEKYQQIPMFKGLRFHLSGIRPLMRLTSKIRLFKLRKQ